jgi:mono/diheme cytochrome c family protein
MISSDGTITANRKAVFMLIRTSLFLAMLLCAAGALQAAETTERQSFDAAALYRASCAPCHGMAGDGDGPVAAVLASEVPRLDDLTKRNEGVYPAEYVRDVIDGRSEIGAHGSREMPVWGLRFQRLHESSQAPGAEATDEAKASAQLLIGQLVEYVRTLQADP